MKKTSLIAAVQVSQGAEARVWSTTFLSRKTIVKQRFNKKYRHPTLDVSLTLQRLKGEVRSMIRARKLGILTPVPYYVEHDSGTIYMEQIDGISLKQARCPHRNHCFFSQNLTTYCLDTLIQYILSF